MTAELDLAESIARPWTFEKEPRGTLGLVAERTSQRLLWDYAVAPLASEWIHQAAQAIRVRIPLDVLLDQVAQFPTYSEAYLAALVTFADCLRPWNCPEPWRGEVTGRARPSHDGSPASRSGPAGGLRPARLQTVVGGSHDLPVG